MGVSWHHVKSLIDTYQAGASFENTLTLGRLNLLISPWELRRQIVLPELAGKYDQFLTPHPIYSEPLFELLGAKNVCSIDASAYEAANIIHDLNKPIADEFKQRFDLVDDGGTLEHVFHFPTALKNAMELVKVGGHLLINTVANNFMGHGFYQFSPELFYRTLSEENGFQIERLVMHNRIDNSQWYDVPDPKSVRSRIELISEPIQIGLWVRARRVAAVPIFANTPQQSDYSELAWKSDGAAPSEPPKNKFLNHQNPLRQKLRHWLEDMAPNLLQWVRRRKTIKRNAAFSFDSQPRVFKPADGWSLPVPKPAFPILKPTPQSQESDWSKRDLAA
jgi:hypothetical protein